VTKQRQCIPDGILNKVLTLCYNFTILLFYVCGKLNCPSLMHKYMRRHKRTNPHAHTQARMCTHMHTRTRTGWAESVKNFLARLKCDWSGWNTAEIISTAFQPHTAEINRAVEINHLKAFSQKNLQQNSNILLGAPWDLQMRPGVKVRSNSERKSNWNTAETISTAFYPHAVEINRAVEISRFNRTSTAFLQRNLPIIKYIVRSIIIN